MLDDAVSGAERLLRPRGEAEDLVLLRTFAAEPRVRGVAALALAANVSWGTLYYAFGVLLAPMAVRAHASPTRIAAAFSLALLASGLVAPAVGRSIDRVGAGCVMVFGSALGALGFVALTGATSVLSLYATWIVLGIAHACTSYEPAFAAVTRWFDDLGRRRRALLVLTTVGGFASTAFVPLVAALVSRAGFDATVLVLAALLAFAVTPLHALVATVPTPPLRPEEVVTREASQPTLGLPGLACVFALHAFASTGATSFLFLALVGDRVDSSEAAWSVALVGASQVPARWFHGTLVGRVHAGARLPLLLAVQAAAIAGWGVFDGASRIVALVAFGAANGLSTLERASLLVAWFGRGRFASVGGVIASAGSFARAAAPVAVVAIAERTSSATTFAALGALLVAATLAQGVNVRWRHAELGRRRIPEEDSVEFLRPSASDGVDRSRT